MACSNLHLLFHVFDKRHDAGGRERPEKVADFLNKVVEASKTAPNGYVDYRNSVCTMLPNNRTFVAISKMAVGRGNEAPGEWEVSLDRTYGVPIIPASSIKGMMLREAFEQLNLRPEEDKPLDWGAVINDPARPQQDRDNAKVLRQWFGDTGCGGDLIVYDALWKPTETEAFKRDVITRHNGPYYEGEGYADDTAAPVPVSGISIRKGTQFTFFLEAPKPFCADCADRSCDHLKEPELSAAQEALQAAAWDLLQSALQNFGIGGKTSSGYGRMKPLQA